MPAHHLFGFDSASAALASVVPFFTAMVTRGGPSRPDDEAAVIADLVLANRILFDQGVVDGFGHVSARHPTKPDRYFLSRSLAPGLVTEADILEFTLDSEPLDARGQTLYTERYIHGEVYRARPDVKAVVHSHSPSVIPFGVSIVPLRPIYHMSSFLGAGAPVFEIRKVSGMTDMLIRNGEQGRALAQTLAGNAVALMRGHGSVAVGETLPQAVYRGIYTELNARLQSEALRLGPVTYLEAEECVKATATNNASLSRAWELWKRRVTAKE
jgi:ribulose-5-phosphate 4-epimerase/fuculose-1-phosphate aldolase